VVRNHFEAILHDVQTLFDSGTIGTLTDSELLGRFMNRRDETADSAFTALIERHGPMVLRVCRSILRDSDDAQDAFQATFLVFVRRAATVRNRESVGSWLYGVAVRVSTRARAARARRRRHEDRAGKLAADRSSDDLDSLEISTILHEELRRLPNRYRAAVVACYLEGQTCEAAARQLSLPVGTIKSRLSRARARLLRQFIRRGIGPGEVLGSVVAPASVLPQALVRRSASAMLKPRSGLHWPGQCAAVPPIAQVASTSALPWALGTARTMRVNGFVSIAALLIVGLAATGATLLSLKGQNPTVPAQASPQTREPDTSTSTATKVEMAAVRVVGSNGTGVRNVEVEVFEPESHRQGPRFRTGTDGTVIIPVNPRREALFLASPDAETLGWAYRASSGKPTGKDKSPIPIVLLPRRHRVDGAVVDSAGKPIAGVQIRVGSLQHDINGRTRTLGNAFPQRLGSAVTDRAGRYSVMLPDKTLATLIAFHPRYVGPAIMCRAEEGALAPVTLEDAGAIAGTLIDAATRRPVERATLSANRIEYDKSNRKLIGAGWAITDTTGHFRITSLSTGVYNLCLHDSSRGKRFTAQAVEGVRVSAGAVALADLKLVPGRHIHGTVVDDKTGKPAADTAVACWNSASTGLNLGEPGFTDDQGRFEFFVPPGRACVYLSKYSPHIGGVHVRSLIVPNDRDPDPVVLKAGTEPDWSRRDVTHDVRIQVRAEQGKEHSRDEARILVGRILDETGSPIAGVQVLYNDRKESIVVTSATDRLGLFRMRGLPLDKFTLLVQKEGYASVSATVPVNAREIDVMLPNRTATP
jgi:RNA polymerase sigma factor (sigma-70 family)